MDMLISVAITSAYLYSSAVVFGLMGDVFFWELATLIDIMLIGHWLEMRSVMGASRALEELVKLKRTLSPDLVLMPSPRDLHQDHSTVSQEGLRAFKTTTILAYELIWNNLDFNTTAFVRLEEANIDAKFMALTHYESQSDRKYMQKDFIKSLAHVRGVQVGCEFAECFEVIRWMI